METINIGDILQLGRHRLMCGDAFNVDHVDMLMGSVRADMLYCDPPYGMNLKTNYSRYEKWAGTNTGKRLSHASNPQKTKSYPAVIGDGASFNPMPIISHFDFCKEQFWWGADYYRDALPTGGSWLVWDKRLDERFDDMWGSSFELCWSRNSHRREVIRERWIGVIGMEYERQEMGLRNVPPRCHPTQKPIRLAKRLINQHSNSGSVVVDLFAGSGSTLLACERLNRKCYTMEWSPHYCDVIANRYKQMTAQPRLFQEDVA